MLAGKEHVQRQIRDVLKALDQKQLKSAMTKATTPTVRKMRNRAPVGEEGHETYKGRFVAPGFLKRSIKKSTRKRDGKISVVIGVAAEAYYGVTFVEFGTKHMRGQRWFKSTFVRDREGLIQRFELEARKKITAAIR